MSSAANFNNMNYPKTNQHPSVPSPMVKNSEGFIVGEMAILQAKMEKLFPIDMADFQTMKQSNTSAKISFVIDKVNRIEYQKGHTIQTLKRTQLSAKESVTKIPEISLHLVDHV